MLAVERENAIIRELNNSNFVYVADLHEKLKVSEETVRRDLDRICKNSSVFERVHGGAYRIVPNKNTPFVDRVFSDIGEKETIASLCFSKIENGDYIFLDSSTSSLYLARLMASSGYKLTVITNSIEVVKELCKSDNINIVGIGGQYSSLTHSFVGYSAVEEASKLYASKAFISCPGIDLKFGISSSSEEEGSIRKVMIQNSKTSYLMADSKKFGKCEAHLIVNLEEIDTVITDKNISDEWKDFLYKHNVKLEVAD